jgi:urease accessory protein
VPDPQPASPLQLSRRHAQPPVGAGAGLLRLPLTAEERTRLRGQRRTACGRDLLLLLPRGGALEPGEWLAGEDGAPLVRVEAAPEALLLVRAEAPLELLRAAYHLGNRHVALEIRPGELRLLDDPVLADLLRQRGLDPQRCDAPFLPESGAYAAGHGHEHGHSHAHAPA